MTSEIHRGGADDGFAPVLQSALCPAILDVWSLTGSYPETGFETIILLKDHTERAARRPPVWRIGKHQNAPRLELCFD